jgi:tetratricopeptide (TPR) repeat protein
VGARPRTIAITAFVLGAILAALTVNRVLSLDKESTAWADAAEKINTRAPVGAVGRWRPLMHRGNQHLLHQRFQAALADFEAAGRLGDPTGLTHYHRGLVLQRLGRRDEALLAFSEAGKAKAMAFGASGLPHYESGKLLFSMGRYSAAISELDLALAALEDPTERLTALKIRAQSNARRGRTGEAVSDYRRALEINPAERSTRIGLALALNGNGQGKEAITVLNAVQGESDGWDVRLGRAMVYEAMGLREKAIEEARVALGMNRGNSALQEFARKLGLKP